MINEWTATEIRVGQFRLQRRNRSLSIEENRVPPRVSTSSSRCFEPFRDGWKGQKENEKEPRQTRPTSLLSFGENWKWRETKLDTSCLLTMEKKTKELSKSKCTTQLIYNIQKHGYNVSIEIGMSFCSIINMRLSYRIISHGKTSKLQWNNWWICRSNVSRAYLSVNFAYPTVTSESQLHAGGSKA